MSKSLYIPKRVVMSLPPSDDSGCVGIDGKCTTMQTQFTHAWVRTGNRTAAYIEVYQPDPMTSPGTIYNAASVVARKPCVEALYNELMQQRALELVVDIREALQWQFDIATADPNEICYVAKRPCRHCYGQEHKYQWVDDDEYVAACVEAIDKKKLPPNDDGGYGYTKALDPAKDCPKCLGDGDECVVTNDTTKLQGKARKLFKGVEYKNGQWVPQMHDQQKAWEMVCRMLGGFDDKLSLELSQRKGNTYPAELVSEQDAARAYVTVMG